MAASNPRLDASLLVLRLVFGGFMLINHGWNKTMTLFSGEPISFPNPIGVGPEISLGLAVFAEALCALLVVIGFFTRLSTIPLIITMLVAAFVTHAADSFYDKEHALLFAVVYGVLFLLGPGRYSVDARMGRD